MADHCNTEAPPPLPAETSNMMSNNDDKIDLVSALERDLAETTRQLKEKDAALSRQAGRISALERELKAVQAKTKDVVLNPAAAFPTAQWTAAMRAIAAEQPHDQVHCKLEFRAI